MSVGAEEKNLEFPYLLFWGRDSQNSALSTLKESPKMVFSYLSLAQAFKFSLAF